MIKSGQQRRLTFALSAQAKICVHRKWLIAAGIRLDTIISQTDKLIKKNKEYGYSEYICDNKGTPHIDD